ncbi:hypothetical protein vseg_012204 [Gypsophila vaccaria]
MAETDTKYKVGYAMKPEKVASVIQPSLVTHCKQRGIELVLIDLCKPLVEQGPFHCLVHKLYTPDWQRQLADFQSAYPDAVIVDNPSDIERLHNRVSMLDVVDSLSTLYSDSGACVGAPRQVVVEDTESLVSDSSLALNFPVIAKPLLANGSDLSHEMCLVFDASALNEVKTPVVLQEFVNHGGVLFKVYVAGNHVKCVKRTSLPDVGKDERGIMPFSQISGMDASAQEQEEPLLEFVHSVAKGLKDATKLNLFNFDMIRDVKASNTMYLIIDINYFPGYAKVTGFENILTDFFWDIVTRNQLPHSTVNFGTNADDADAEVTHVGCSLDAVKHEDLHNAITSHESNRV